MTDKQKYRIGSNDSKLKNRPDLFISFFGQTRIAD